MNHPTPQDLAQIVRKGTLDDVLALLDAGLGQDRPAELGLGLAMASFLGRREIVRELVRRGAPLNLPDGLADASPIAMAVKGGQTKTVRLLISYGAKVPPGLETGLTHEEYAEALAKAKARRHAARRAKERAARQPGASLAENHAVPSAAVTSAAVPSPSAKPSTIASTGTPAAVVTTATPPPLFTPPAPAIASTVREPEMPEATAATPPADMPPLEFSYTPPPSPQPQPSRQLGSIVEEIEIDACFGLDTNVLETDLNRLGLADTPAPDKG